MELKEFKNKEFKLEAVKQKDQIYFKAKDVALALGYQSTAKDITTHVSDKYKVYLKDIKVSQIAHLHPDTIFLLEPGLYELIFSSKLESALKSRVWVFEEVLPTIRKTDEYSLKKYPRSIAFKISSSLVFTTLIASSARAEGPRKRITIIKKIW